MIRRDFKENLDVYPNLETGFLNEEISNRQEKQ